MPDPHQGQKIPQFCEVLPCYWPVGQQEKGILPPNGNFRAFLVKSGIWANCFVLSFTPWQWRRNYVTSLEPPAHRQLKTWQPFFCSGLFDVHFGESGILFKIHLLLCLIEAFTSFKACLLCGTSPLLTEAKPKYEFKHKMNTCFSF